VKKRVLIVEDDRDLNESLCDLLVEHGYEVASALDGLDACAAVLERGFRPDAILLDLFMPIMDGLEFLRRREEEPPLLAVPVIVVSAKATLLSDAGLEPFAVVSKPLHLDRLLDALERACAGQGPAMTRVS
jgi:CheY-like chemotaxis protein